MAHAFEYGAAPLPDLTAADLCALSGTRQVLFEDSEWAWWAGLDEVTRQRLSVGVLEILVDRRLLDPPPEHEEESTANTVAMRVRPPLAIILAARQQPGFVAVCTVPDHKESGEPRMYGIVEDGKPVRAVVAEQVSDKKIGEFGQLHKFGLVSMAQAGKALASWARLPTPPHRLTGYRPPRIIDVYWHRESEPLTRERIAVRAGRKKLQIARWGIDGTEHPAVTCDRDELGKLLGDILALR